ncbi:tetratricopeptide repeat protein, partial [bacterium]|nr:tetratricopeptide repeat protein [bacterium]
MSKRLRAATCVAAAAVLAVSAGGGCAYFNTLYNAKQKFNEALEVKERADPEREKISSQEERLYAEAFERAAKVVKYYPDSRWVDDALLLMARSSHEKGDYSTALRKYDEILSFYPDSDLVPRTLVMEARTAIAIRDYDRAVRALNRARDADKKELRGDVTYFLGVVQESRGSLDEALAAYATILEKHKGSQWYAEAGMRAGALATERGDEAAAVDYFERVRKHARTIRERYDGGMHKGQALMAIGEWKRARTTFHDVGDRTANEDLRSKAYRMEGEALARSGEPDKAEELYRKLIADFARTEAAAEAQFAIAERYDREGNLERAQEQYELVKEQGTGHPSWQEAARRQTEIERVLTLREEIAAEDAEDAEDVERKRFLLAEQLLEKIGDIDGALEEYAALAKDAEGTEWGFRALYAEAWVLENRLANPDSADALLFRLANRDTRTEVGAAARRRHHMPVWKFEELSPPKVVFIRAEGDEESEDIVLTRVDPREVPLPPGVREVKVWARITVEKDGSAKSVKVVKSGGDDFDEAVKEAALASRFLAPGDGGPEITVVEYVFPPPREDEATPDGA